MVGISGSWGQTRRARCGGRRQACRHIRRGSRPCQPMWPNLVYTPFDRSAHCACPAMRTLRPSGTAPDAGPVRGLRGRPAAGAAAMPALRPACFARIHDRRRGLRAVPAGRPAVASCVAPGCTNFRCRTWCRRSSTKARSPMRACSAGCSPARRRAFHPGAGAVLVPVPLHLAGCSSAGSTSRMKSRGSWRAACTGHWLTGRCAARATPRRRWGCRARSASRTCAAPSPSNRAGRGPPRRPAR